MSEPLTVQSEGATLQAWVSGAGPEVLFVQGTATVGEAWRPQIEALSGDFRCAWLDNRGIGESEARGPIGVPEMGADVVALLDALGWDRAHLVGHSLGGLILQQVALEAPERVQSLVLSCTFARGPQATRLTPTTLCQNLRVVIGTRAMRRQAFLELLAPSHQHTPETADFLASRIGRDLADRPPVVMKQVRAMSRYDRSAELGRIGAPTLVQSASDDPIARPSFGKELAQAIPGARYVELPGRHAHTLLDPEPFTGLVREHLERHSGRR